PSLFINGIFALLLASPQGQNLAHPECPQTGQWLHSSLILLQRGRAGQATAGRRGAEIASGQEESCDCLPCSSDAGYDEASCWRCAWSPSSCARSIGSSPTFWVRPGTFVRWSP